MKNTIRYLINIVAALLLLVLAACGSTAEAPAETESDEQAEDSGAASTEADTAISIQESWVRSAVMTGGQGQGAGQGQGQGAGQEDRGQGQGQGEGPGQEMMQGGANSAAYMRIVNNSDTADALVAAATDAAETVELHTVIMEDNVMRMRPVPQIEVPANGEATLQPGGYHVMLLGITRDLQEGDMVDLTLTFENAGDINITAPVQQGGGMMMSDGMQDDGMSDDGGMQDDDMPDDEGSE